MREKTSIFFAVLLCLFCLTGVRAQQAASSVKTINFPAPKFPAGAGDMVYGGKVSVAVAVDKKGKVDVARIYFSMAPCSDLNGETVIAIRKAALEAAQKTTFEPFIEDGKPVEKVMKLDYDLKPKSSQTDPPYVPKLVSGGVLNGRAKSLEKPRYPGVAMANRLSGSVSVQVLIDEEGKVISAGAIAGHPEFQAEAIRAACKSLFTPTTLAGNPVKVSGVIVYNFVP